MGAAPSTTRMIALADASPAARYRACRLAWLKAPAPLVVAAIAIAVLVSAQQAPPNVLLITIDTVRADHIGAYGYAKASTPTLDRIARDGVRFLDATTPAPLTA